MAGPAFAGHDRCTFIYSSQFKQTFRNHKVDNFFSIK